MDDPEREREDLARRRLDVEYDRDREELLVRDLREDLLRREIELERLLEPEDEEEFREREREALRRLSFPFVRILEREDELSESESESEFEEEDELSESEDEESSFAFNRFVELVSSFLRISCSLRILSASPFLLRNSGGISDPSPRAREAYLSGCSSICVLLGLEMYGLAADLQLKVKWPLPRHFWQTVSFVALGLLADGR